MPIREQGRDPNRPPLLLNDKKISQGEYFPGHLSQTRSSSSENNWIPKKTGNLLGTKKILKRLPTNDRVDISNLTIRAETFKKIGRKEKISSSRGRDSKRNFSYHFGTPSENAGDIKKLRGTSRTERIPQVNAHIEH